MAVRFDEIVFRNDNGIDVLLTIEAPVGHTVVSEHPVPRHSEYRVQPGVDNCESVRLVARAHVIGSINGSLAARTEKGAQAA